MSEQTPTTTTEKAQGPHPETLAESRYITLRPILHGTKMKKPLPVGATVVFNDEDAAKLLADGAIKPERITVLASEVLDLSKPEPEPKAKK